MLIYLGDLFYEVTLAQDYRSRFWNPWSVIGWLKGDHDDDDTMPEILEDRERGTRAVKRIGEPRLRRELSTP